METIYTKHRPAHEILMEYYWYCDHRSMIEDEWRLEDQKYKNHCDSLYKKYIQTVALEKRIKEDSKSAKVAQKLEKIKADYSDTILLKKLKNKK